MSENIKQKDLNVTITFDDKKLREIVDDLIIHQGLKQVVHCKDCKYNTKGRCEVWSPYHVEPYDYCSYGERKDETD